MTPERDVGEGPRLKLVLVALAVAVQAVPGYQLLSGGDWHPPEMQGGYALGAAVAGPAVLALLFLTRDRLLGMHRRVVAGAFLTTLVLSLVLAFVYRAMLDTRYVTYVYAGSTFSELVPFGTSRWVDAELLRRIESAHRGGITAPSSAADVRPRHIARALQRHGPPVLREKAPAAWRHFTTSTIWLTYVTGIALGVAAFGMLALRLAATTASDAGKDRGS